MTAFYDEEMQALLGAYGLGGIECVEVMVTPGTEYVRRFAELARRDPKQRQYFVRDWVNCHVRDVMNMSARPGMKSRETDQVRKDAIIIAAASLKRLGLIASDAVLTNLAVTFDREKTEAVNRMLLEMAEEEPDE